MSHTDERNRRIERLGHLLFSAASALENERWDLVARDAAAAEREARELIRLDRRATEENQ